MMLLVLALLGLPVKALAAEISPSPWSCLIRRTDFIPAEEELRRLSFSLQMMKASPLLKVLDQNGKVTDQCSSSVVSDAGHILTVGHCLEGCLERAGAYRELPGFSEPDPVKLKQVNCTVEINGQRTSVKVLGISKCRRGQRFAPGATVNCKGSDFAILELRDPSVNSKACLKVSQRALRPGDGVAAIGYPVKTRRTLNREYARDSDGVGQFVSTGQVIPLITRCFRKVDVNPIPSSEQPGFEKFSEEQTFANVQEWVRSGALIQSTVDIQKRSSGGPLLLESTGELVGVATLVAHENWENTECEGSSFFSTMGMIHQQLHEDFPQIDTKKVFGCLYNSVQRRTQQTDL